MAHEAQKIRIAEGIFHIEDPALLTRIEVLLAEAKQEQRKPRAQPGFAKGIIAYMAPDFDAPLDDLKDYM